MASANKLSRQKEKRKRAKALRKAAKQSQYKSNQGLQKKFKAKKKDKNAYGTIWLRASKGLD